MTGITPQLHRCAAWLASLLQDERGERLIGLDPVPHLEGDIHLRSDRDKALVTKALLDRCSGGGGDHWRSHYWKLAHPGLLAVVRQSLAHHDSIVRRVAVDIARGCGLSALVPQIVDLALDGAEDDGTLRWLAADVAVALAAPEELEALRPLTRTSREEDPDDQLRGTALGALWQAKRLSAPEAFELLGPPRNPRYFGAFYRFVGALTAHLTGTVDRESVTAGLRWWIDLLPVRKVDQDGIVDDLKRAVLARALEALDDLTITQHLQEVVTTLRRVPLVEVVQAAIEGEPLRARRFLEICRRADLNPRAICIRSELEVPQAWVAEWLREPADADVTHWWVQLALSRGLRPEWPEAEAFLRLYCDEPVRFAAFQFLHICELDSERSSSERASWELNEKYMAEAAERRGKRGTEPPSPEPVDDPAEWVKPCLDALDDGDLDAFPDLLLRLTLAPGATRYEHDWADVPSSYGWKNASPHDRSRILRFARMYLHGQDPRPSEWLEASGTPRYLSAGLAALHLLVTYPGEPIPPEIWQRWAPGWVTYHGPTITPELARQVDEHSGSNLNRAIRLRCLASTSNPLTMTMLLERLRGFWPSRVHEVAGDLVLDPSIEPKKRGIAAHWRLAHNPKDDVVIGQLEKSQPQGHWVELAGGALLGAPSEVWPRVKQRVFDLEPAAARRVLTVATNDLSTDPAFPDALTAGDAGELLMWLRQSWEEDTGVLRGFTPSWFVRTVTESLRRRRTPEAVQALRRVGDRWAADEVDEAARADAWPALSPDQIRGLLKGEPSVQLVETVEKPDVLELRWLSNTIAWIRRNPELTSPEEVFGALEAMVRARALEPRESMGREQAEDLRSQLRIDLTETLLLIHRWGAGCFLQHGTGELMPEAVFQGAIAIALASRGWLTVALESQIGAGRSDVAARHPMFDGAIVIEVKRWGADGYKTIQKQVESYRVPETKAMATVTVSLKQTLNADEFRQTCLENDGVLLQSPAPLIAIERQSRHPDWPPVPIEHHLLKLPRR